MIERGLTPEEERCRAEDPEFPRTLARAIAKARGWKERQGEPSEIRSDDDFATHLDRIHERVRRGRGRDAA